MAASANRRGITVPSRRARSAEASTSTAPRKRIGQPTESWVTPSSRAARAIAPAINGRAALPVSQSTQCRRNSSAATVPTASSSMAAVGPQPFQK